MDIDFGLGKRLQQRVAIITGGGGGIGGSTARLFAAHGAKVVVTDLDAVAARETADAIRAEGGEALSLAHDVCSESEWNNIVRRVKEHWGGIDILVNNAGLHRATPMAEISRAEWQRHLDINLTGPFLGTQYASYRRCSRVAGA